MSRTFAIAFVLALISGCVDPHSRFNDFGNRVTDASQKADIDAMPLKDVPDISGTWLIGLAPFLAPNKPILMSATMGFTKTGTGATISFSLQPLTAADRTPVGNPTVLDNVPVNNAGEFLAVFAALPKGSMNCKPPAQNPVILPGAANPISGSELDLEVSLKGVIRSKNLFCGTVSGYVNNLGCLDLSSPPGSTFAAIRIKAGTTGSALPPPVSACPVGMLPDAGTPDAAAPDAAALDAAPQDAVPQDAVPRD